jgi:hypothetical protein
MIKPSNLALIGSGLLIAVALILLFNEINKGTNIQGIVLINLVLFLSTAISLHGLLHMGAELYYDYNPLTGKLFY